MAVQVPKEYVRQQLKSMGIQEVTDEELDSYTRDFSRLIQEHLECNSSSASDLSSLSETGACVQSSGTPSTHQIGYTSVTSTSSGLSSVEHTPLPTVSIPPPGSAVFKTFPGDKENRVQLLSPSLSPNSILLSPDRSTSIGNNASLMIVESSGGATGKDGSVRRRPVKRKVLRKCNGESRVFDESFGSVSASPLVGGQELKGVARQVSDLSLSSVVSSETMDRVYLPSPPPEHGRGRDRMHCCKSFIRPPTTHPHLRGLKKCDPVQRYHEFRQVWESHKPPGEKSRNSLRWHIREQLLHQDVPYFEAPQRIYKPNDFMVPTDKKRSSLRWEIRHNLAHQ